MSFARPDLLGLGLVLPALLLWALARWVRRRRRAADRIGDSALLQRLGAGDLRALPWARLLLLVAAMAALGIAAAGPQWGRRATASESSALNVVLALDVSKSMLARDVAPSRLERERLLVRRLLRDHGGDRFGLVVFAGRAYVLSPVTIDHSAIQMYLDALDPQIVSQGGSSLASAVLQATDLARGSEDVAGDRAVVLVSDGEALEDVEQIRQAAERAAAAGVRFYTVGVATRQGGNVPEVDEVGQVIGYKQGEDGTPVVSRLEEELLRGIAETTGGDYFHVDDPQLVERLGRALGGLERTSAGTERRTEPREQYVWFAGLALFLIALDALLAMRGAPRRARRPPVLRGWRGRRARIAAVLLLALPGFGIGDLERGNRLYRAGRYEEAVAAYTAALEDGRGTPQLHYNLGTALLQLGRLEEAERQFQSALRDIDPELRQRALYNLGNRFLLAARQGGEAQLEQYDAAVEAYKQALRITPRDAQAKWNLELALRERAEQQQRRQPPQDQQQDEQDPQQQPQQGGGGGAQPQQSSGQGNDSGDANERQPMSQEQAERILSAADQDERELARERLRQGQRRTPVRRDW